MMYSYLYIIKKYNSNNVIVIIILIIIATTIIITITIIVIIVIIINTIIAIFQAIETRAGSRVRRLGLRCDDERTAGRVVHAWVRNESQPCFFHLRHCHP